MAVGFFHNSARCYGCKTCMIACANEKTTTPGVFIRRVRQFNTEGPGHAFVSMSCNHCDEPACLANCPVSAYTKDPETGLVIQDHSLCIGCKTCINMCPFHAPAYDEEESKTYKCDGCIDRQADGLDPVCVVSCPSANIVYGEFDNLPEGTSINDMAPTMPNFKVAPDPDIEADLASIFADIDEAANIVDTGGEGYPQS